MHNEFCNNPNGQLLLRERPEITSALLRPDNVKSFPDNSLGSEYFHFMNKHQYSSDDRSPVRFIEDSEKRYVMTRYRQVHDFWHVIAGLPPNEFGEIVLKW